MVNTALLLPLLLSSTLLICLADRTSAPRRGFVYNVPRPGLTSGEDCFTGTFAADHARDFSIMNAVGAQMIIANCKFDLYKNHQLMLEELGNNNLKLLIPIDYDISVNKWKEWIDILDRKLERKSVGGVIFHTTKDIMEIDINEFVRKINDLLFFKSFMSIRQFQTWIHIRYDSQRNTKVLLGILKTIEDRMSGITGWSITAFCQKDLDDWTNDNAPTLAKPLMVQIGADDWDTKASVATPELQKMQLELLWTTAVSNPRFDTIVVNSFANTFDAGNDLSDRFSSKVDICPDPNPYLLTTCGVAVESINYGDKIVNVEMLGVFLPYETLWMTRCLAPKYINFKELWGEGSLDGVNLCALSISVHLYIVIGVGAMLLLAIIFAIISVCSASRLTNIADNDQEDENQRLLNKETQNYGAIGGIN